MKYRKKPVVIEAWQLPAPRVGSFTGVPPWLLQAVVDQVVEMAPTGGAVIHTLEGTMRADVGDWVICGVKNEIYPCKPDVFALTYEPVNEP